MHLSKSKYLSGLQCQKRLWLSVHKPELAPLPLPAQQRLFDQGTRVGELARAEFPGGLLIDADHKHIPEAIQQSQIAVNDGIDVLFEGCFVHEDVRVRPDILKQNESDSWSLIEVKSSTSVKEENIHDDAVQTWVLQGRGLDIGRMFLMHINRDCVYPDLSDLFVVDDITKPVQTLLPDVPDRLEEFKRLLKESEPEIAIGQHCSKPYECPFKEHCWRRIPEYSTFNLPRLRWPVKERLLAEIDADLDRLPPDFPLNYNQQKFLESYSRKEPVMNQDGIRKELDTLDYPLYFLDFETDGPAIPRFNGTRSYEQVPFQYSCHTLDEKGHLGHKEYLHTLESDPRKPLLASLLNHLEKRGTIIAYNAGFERGVLNKLARWFPEYSNDLQDAIHRIWDQLIIFRNYYFDYRFKGSNSLKSVLPVMAPSMSYEDLEVSDGTQAQVAWNEMIRMPEGAEKEQLIRDLKVYCGQDTLAMVEMHNQLKKEICNE